MSRADTTRLREALEELVRTEGWRIFCAYVDREWKGDGFHSRIGSDLKSDNPLATQVTYRTSLEIFRALQWPTNHILELKGDPN